MEISDERRWRRRKAIIEIRVIVQQKTQAGASTLKIGKISNLYSAIFCLLCVVLPSSFLCLFALLYLYCIYFQWMDSSWRENWSSLGHPSFSSGLFGYQRYSIGSKHLMSMCGVAFCSCISNIRFSWLFFYNFMRSYSPAQNETRIRPTTDK